MSSSAQRSEILCSGNDGVYDVSFFGASVRHTIDQSRTVFEALSGPSLGAQSGTWQTLSDSDRDAYLLENHELAHHALMYSTPAGVLNWRMNQVISRDIQWLLARCDQHGVTFEDDSPPRALLSTREWQVGFRRRSDVDRGTKREMFRTISGLEDVLQLRRLLFTPGAPQEFVELTFGDLLELLRRAYAYLESRCEVRLNRNWRTKLPHTTRVFPEDRAFNLVDIAEVHAISMELFLLRAVSDLDAFHTRATRARSGPYGIAFGIAANVTKEVNELGMSPNQMQLLSLISFSAALDVVPEDAKPTYLEEALPWWRFSSSNPFSTNVFLDTLQNCLALSTQKLIGEGSRWLQFADVPLSSFKRPSLSRITEVTKTVASLGLDRQVNAIHAGASLNWRFLATQWEETFGGELPMTFDRLSPQSWLPNLLTAVIMVEYRDGIFFRSADFSELYPAQCPLRKLRHLDDYEHLIIQIAGQIINGAIPRITYAAYSGCAVPRLDILTPKLADYFQSASLAAQLIDLISALIQGHLSPAGRHATLAPITVRLERYI